MTTTTAAATQAGVTVATIRTWCRKGVISAVKTAGRWVIDTASLARRIAIGALRHPARKETPVLDLTATYTFTHAGATEPTTVTPLVKHLPHKGKTTISRLAAFFADRFDAITDEGDRVHALTLFTGASIAIFDAYDADWDGEPQARDGGRLRTTYRGGVPGISIDDVLDLADQLRTQLAA